MKAYNEKKAGILYDFLDGSSLFHGTVRREDRSLMNVPFVTGNQELDAKFVPTSAMGFRQLILYITLLFSHVTTKSVSLLKILHERRQFLHTFHGHGVVDAGAHGPGPE